MHVDIPGSSAIAEFYDGLASDYHLIYADRWEQSLRHQGGALDALIRSSLPEARDVLDCACGIGTQAIGLALLGYRVTGTDISERSLQRARDTAAQLGTPLTVLPADFRDLRGVPGEFDVVTACDNAIAHLLDQADVDLALKQMYRKLRPGGLLAISVRDYDRALKDRPRPIRRPSSTMPCAAARAKRLLRPSRSAIGRAYCLGSRFVGASRG